MASSLPGTAGLPPSLLKVLPQDLLEQEKKSYSLPVFLLTPLLW